MDEDKGSEPTKRDLPVSEKLPATEAESENGTSETSRDEQADAAVRSALMRLSDHARWVDEDDE